MPWTYTDEYYKDYTRATWNESAPAYASLAANLDLYNPALLRAAAPRRGDRVLDLAAGLGEPALTLAPLVAPGRVLGIDLSERMVELASTAAKERRAENVEFRVMDAERLTLPDASFSLATCRFGLQIVTDPDRVLAEILRVLEPGGRVAATVWGPGERCPILDVLVGPMLEHAEPDETGYLPTPYEMGGEGELLDMLEDAGFDDAHEERVTQVALFGGVEAYLRAVLEGTPLGHSLREEDEAVQRVVLRETRRNLERWLRPDGSLALPGEAVVVRARRPRSAHQEGGSSSAIVGSAAGAGATSPAGRGAGSFEKYRS